MADRPFLHATTLAFPEVESDAFDNLCGSLGLMAEDLEDDLEKVTCPDCLRAIAEWGQRQAQAQEEKAAAAEQSAAKAWAQLRREKAELRAEVARARATADLAEERLERARYERDQLREELDAWVLERECTLGLLDPPPDECDTAIRLLRLRIARARRLVPLARPELTP